MSEGKYKLKKLVKALEAKKGRHTELVTVYVPAGFSLHEIVSQLRQEQGTAENIKSKAVRKNVVTALEKIMRYIQLYKQTPEHGLALFCGNVSEKEGVADIELWAIEPPEPIKTRLYWCDQRFVLEPLQKMIEEKQVYGIICLDKSEADIAMLRGKKIEPLVHFDSIVPGKTRAGGQSSARFSRIREGLLNDFMKEVGEAANKIFLENREVIGILISGPGPIKEYLLKEGYIDNNVKKRVLGTVDIGSTGEHGLHETIARGEHLLREAAVINEKKLLQRFFEHLQKGTLAAYGIDSVIKAVESGAVDAVLVTEDAPYEELELECACGIEKQFVRAGKDVKCKKCGQTKRVLGRKDIIEALEELAKRYGSKVEVVSKDTREGGQFSELGGIGAILRYEI